MTHKSEEESMMFAGFNWDIDITRRELQSAYKFLSHANSEGIGSLGDKDEHGHTTLNVCSREKPRTTTAATNNAQEIIILIGLLGPVYRDVVGEVDALLSLVERSGVDLDAVVVGGFRKRSYSTLERMGWSAYTANTFS
jgi:hypothetical protein